METTRHRYSDTELKAFKTLIENKIIAAKEEMVHLSTTLSQSDPDGGFHTLEDGAATLEKETNHQMAGRQKKFIEQLEAALGRIANKTYGICRTSGKLIQKERLMAVPHTTQSMEAKMSQH
ncbi:TraR/DksA C4-type zinc finger protein [Mucilaginibacter gynuensis]|uniref:TraR/DksA C4-type zinc finger protein n=1 Tax=Mucilaginibacter gynuensis TaxID=1302236 RepID=A0ABP8GN85_9SPHI